MARRKEWLGHFVLWAIVSPLLTCTASCGDRSPTLGQRGARGALVHLEDELDQAAVASAAPPAAARDQRLWRFDEPRPEWHAVSSNDVPGLASVAFAPLDDGLRVSFAPGAVPAEGPMVGGLATNLDESPLSEWAGVRVRARTRSRLAGLAASYNVDDEDAIPGGFFFFGADEGASPVFNDGSVQSYFLPLLERENATTLRSLGLFAGAVGAGSLDILSVALVPRGASFLENHGVCSVFRDSVTRRTLFAHTPAVLTWRLAVPDAGRVDFGLTCLPGETVAYRVTARAGAGEPTVLLEENVGDAEAWQQRSLDLSPWAGSQVELSLSAASDHEGAVALWGAPILSGRRAKDRPNVIFYVIDGGGADLMSLYGYNRRTTPFLERLAADGAVFNKAYSNSSWTQPSTASFMTSLHHSVLGGLRRGIHSTPVPAAAVTMAEHMRRGGYQTVCLTANPNAGRVIGLERGVDLMRDVDTEDHSTSSTELHEWFWKFREAYPGGPYWIHFQTTDVHEPNEPEPPFAGLFVSPDERAQLETKDGQLWEKAGDLFGTTSISDFYDRALERSGIDRRAYFNSRRGLYDETMAHQDHQLGQFVEQLKARGEWDNTLLVVASDHGHPAGTFARFGRGLFEPQPDGWQGALFDSYATRIPLMFIWPGHIDGGQRFDQPVSMIDVLPTILDLAGLPQPALTQGRSLAPLLFGHGIEQQPVVFDEFRVDEASGEMVGNLDIIDGRWGVSLEIGPPSGGADATRGRHSVPVGGRWGAVHPFYPEVPRLLLYDLWKDPFALRDVNGEHPELVERYRAELLERWEAHRDLAQHFGDAGEPLLSPEQLRDLQALGYIR